MTGTMMNNFLLPLLAIFMSILPSLHAAVPEIVAHRGASHDAPENTLASMRLGWEQGADAVETDIFLTADNRVVCLHDKDLKRTAGVERAVVEMTLAEVREHEAGAWKHPKWAGEPIPLLKHVLMTVPADKRIFVEIKTGPEITPFLVGEIRASGLRPAQVAFISFNAESCAAIKQALPEHKVLLLSGFKFNDAGVREPSLESVIETAQSLGLDGIDVSFKGELTADEVARVKQAGLFLAMYTVNEPGVAIDLAHNGVDSITTDKPAEIRAALQAAQAAAQ